MTNGPLDLLLVGRAGVDLYSLDYGRTIQESKKFAKYVGGTAANVAVGAARLGLRTALATRVGDDELGDYIIGYLKKERVDVGYIRKDPAGRTGIVFAEILPGRDGKFVFYREKAADLLVTNEDIPASLIKRTKALLVTGIGLSANPSARTIYNSMAVAEREGLTRILNLDWRPSLWNLPADERVSKYEKAISMANVLIGNEGEYLAATGAKTLEAAIDEVKGSDRVLVVTSGEKGSTVYTQGRRNFVPGFKVKVLKGLGGGDGFIAGFVYGLSKKWPLARAARFGNAVGAIVVMGHACSESMPSYGEAAKFLRKNGN